MHKTSTVQIIKLQYISSKSHKPQPQSPNSHYKAHVMFLSIEHPSMRQGDQVQILAGGSEGKKTAVDRLPVGEGTGHRHEDQRLDLLHCDFWKLNSFSMVYGSFQKKTENNRLNLVSNLWNPNRKLTIIDHCLPKWHLRLINTRFHCVYQTGGVCWSWNSSSWDGKKSEKLRVVSR